MPTYLELLNDPRWIERAREVRARQRWKCRGCHTRARLYVHHVRYIPGCLPWDYPPEYLAGLCWECHKAAHQGRYEEVVEAGGEWGMGTTLTTKTSSFLRDFDSTLFHFSKNFGRSDIERSTEMVGVSADE